MSQLKNTTIVVIAVVVVVALVVVLFVPFVPYSYQVQTPYQATQQQEVPVQQVQTMTSPEFTMSSYTLQPNNYVYVSASLNQGMDVSVSWSASDTVNVMIFDSNQFAIYTNNGGAATPITSQNDAQSGTLSFHVSASGTYYLVIFNPHNGFFGLGSHTVGIYSAGGTATWQQTVTVMQTQNVQVTLYKTVTENTTVSVFDMLTHRLPG